MALETGSPAGQTTDRKVIDGGAQAPPFCCIQKNEGTSLPRSQAHA